MISKRGDDLCLFLGKEIWPFALWVCKISDGAYGASSMVRHMTAEDEYFQT